MTKDARFEDGGPKALRLKAEDPDDMQVISTLAQDAVLTIGDISWKPHERRAACLINRFRWEDQHHARRHGRAFERVRSVLVFDDVTHMAGNGIDRSDPDVVLSLLSLAWEAGEDSTGRVVLTFAGDGAIALDAECINVTLQDVTRPYIAPSRKTPQHPDI